MFHVKQEGANRLWVDLWMVGGVCCALGGALISGGVRGGDYRGGGVGIMRHITSPIQSDGRSSLTRPLIRGKN